MRLLTSFISVLAISLSMVLVAPAANAAKEIYTGSFSKKALSGYDAVAYFTESKPVKGTDTFKTEYKGAEWQFSSQANLDSFKANPEKYAPQYGGYCAYAVGKYNDLVSADPEAWKIVNGKLYLNYDKDIQAEWVANQSDYITKANANWPGLIK